MGNIVQSHLVRIGNSRGVRIPKVWLDQLDFGDAVELRMEANQIVIRATRRPRQGWEDQFRAVHERGDDRPVAESSAPTWDVREWEW